MRAETNRAMVEAEWEYKLRRLEIHEREARRNRIGRYFAYGIALLLLIVSIADLLGKDKPTALGIMGILTSLCIAMCTFYSAIMEHRKQRK